jgi:environmental stress-induced protein Ves
VGRGPQEFKYKLLKYNSYRPMPWRNGRGLTREIAREPATGEEFAWRLSLAEIGQACDFSPYPGYRRAIVLVSGKRLQLRFRGHGSCSLGPGRRGSRFEGVWKTRCDVPLGACTDLSLIVRDGSIARSACILRAPLLLRVGSSRRVALADGLYGALFALDGSVSVSESTRARPRSLRAGDTLLLSPRAPRTLTFRSLGQSPAQLVLLRWRPAI